jgi:hypothetical protein
MRGLCPLQGRCPKGIRKKQKKDKRKIKGRK